ncbi:helix-turn-helix domain-containing protein [Desulfatiglans anilini]|uniref:helix-turn-helix domain-containing protein n=1 Tax=Desulfatiglans anilini TaxID=90728 RepID=UPI00338E7E9B
MAIKDEIIRSEDSRYDHRLHGVLLVSQGFSCAKVADLFGHCPRAVQNWMKRFEESSFAGLQETKRSGRPKSIDDKTIRAVASDLRKSTETFGYRQNLWDGKLLRHHLATRYGVYLGVRQCQRLFHRLGFRQRKPRPVIARSDAEAPRRHKKTTADGQTLGS